MKPMATKFQKDADGMMILPVRKSDKPKPSSNKIIAWSCVAGVVSLAIFAEVWAWVLAVS